MSSVAHSIAHSVAFRQGSKLNYYAKVFNGINSTIFFQYINEYNLTDIEFKISVFVKANNSNSSLRTILASYSTSDNKRSWWVGLNSGILLIYSSVDGINVIQTNTTIALNDAKWHKIDIYKIGDMISIEVDGNPVASTGLAGRTLFSNEKTITIGSTSNSPVSLVLNGLIVNPVLMRSSGNIDLFLFAGQSNMSGHGSLISELTGDYSKGQAHVYSYNVFGVGTNEYTTLSPKTNIFGPEISFGINSKVDNYKVAILKVSKGGTGFGEGQWVKGGAQYNELISAFMAFKTKLETNGYTVNVKALIWMQGENDTRSEEWANAYYDNFIQFHSDLIADIGVAELPVLMGRIHDDLPTGGADGRYDYSAIVRENQDLLGQLNYIDVIDTDDLLIADGVHYSTAGQIELGNRFYNIIKQKSLISSVSKYISILSALFNLTDEVNDLSVNNNDGTSINTTTEKVDRTDLP